MEKRLGLLAKNQSGVALVIALVLMVVLTLIGLASTFSSTFEIKHSGNKRGSTDAFYAADSGVQVVMANVKNFDLSGKYTENKYEPFKDSTNPNPNPTKAQVVIEHYPDQHGCPRGTGGWGVHGVDCQNYLIESNGEDQIEINLVKSKATIQEKVARLVPLPD
ncbi:MAG: hypothetical protein A2157_05480 [Deltaproteobacteria bacterium RBG_16_47_11]|nr:MAG: hypothetical protein A2157_05480 [Deltaproteobacteria bacterium RBG_16_47_11]